MRAYWDQLNEREQLIVSIGGICLVLALLYAFIYAPLASSVSREQEAWLDKKTTLLWMQQAARAYTHEAAPKQVTTANLLSVVTDLLNQASFHRFPYQLEQTASGDIQLSFAEVPYNVFIVWLYTQSRHYTLVIKHLNVSKTDMPGVVKVSVVLTVER